MSFWKKVRDFFSGAPGTTSWPDERSVRDAMLARAARGEPFTALDVADDVTISRADRKADDLRRGSDLARALFKGGLLAPLGYTESAGGTWSKAGVATSSSPADRAQRSLAAHTPKEQAAEQPLLQPTEVRRDQYASNPEVLGLSPEEFRQRALRTNPYRTAWIGRVDTIPPQSDERTALIDRGLMLRGLLTQAQLADIHRIGDQWLRFRDAESLAASAAHKSADDAIARKREAKARQRAEKQRLSAERKQARAAAVAKRRAEDIIYLGRGVSKGLTDRRANLEALQRLGLPTWSTPADVARGLSLTVKQLRWLCFHAEATTKTHYVYFEVPKRSGGKRLLAAPHQLLKTTQRRVLDEVLAKVPLEPQAHGFVKGRSTVTNATPHVGQGVVLNVDLKDFFPTITFRRVRGLFQSLGYSPAVATVLGLLCTEAPRRKVRFDQAELWVAVGERCLPQGAPTSPAIANAISRKLDRRLCGRLMKQGWVYTRYADDLTFSRKTFARGDLGFVHASIRHVVQDEGFALNPKKGRAQGRGTRQDVTGLVVNEKPGVPRDEVRRLRAILHQAAKTGLEAQNRDQVPGFRAVLQGKIAYVMMVDREKGLKLKAALDAVR